jgi:hypothetical protein
MTSRAAASLVFARMGTLVAFTAVAFIGRISLG